MQNTRRTNPYIKKEEINLSNYEKTVLVIVILLVGYILWFCINATPAKSQALINPAERAEIERRLDARKLSRHTTVEITESGYRFELNGKFYRL